MCCIAVMAFLGNMYRAGTLLDLTGKITRTFAPVQSLPNPHPLNYRVP